MAASQGVGFEGAQVAGATVSVESKDYENMAGAGLVLLVEDEESMREPLAHLLRLRHYDVITADCSDGALEMLREHRPDAAIVDLHLKRGTGRDVIVRMPPRTPVIIFSGMRSASGELERLRPRTRLIEKPCSLTWLIDTLDQMLTGSTASRRSAE